MQLAGIVVVARLANVGLRRLGQPGAVRLRIGGSLTDRSQPVIASFPPKSAEADADFCFSAADRESQSPIRRRLLGNIVLSDHAPEVRVSRWGSTHHKCFHAGHRYAKNSTEGHLRTTSGLRPSPSFGSFFAMTKIKYAGASLPRLCVQAWSTALSRPPHRRHAPGRAAPRAVAKASFGKGRFICRGQRVSVEKNTCVATAA
jgi:hypothetical protein